MGFRSFRPIGSQHLAVVCLAACAFALGACAVGEDPDASGAHDVHSGDATADVVQTDTPEDIALDIPRCSPTQTECSGTCTDLRSDTHNCGACGTQCMTGQFCDNSMCALVCNPPRMVCGTGPTAVCTDVQTDTSNCGTCGHACGAMQSCVAGACVCPTGMTLCGTVCVDTSADSANCGACGMTCPSVQRCVSGACACPAMGSLCGTACVDTMTDNANCGTCGHACASPRTCVAGACACPSGQTDCSGTCVDTRIDVAHCGSCTNACATGQFCTVGTCFCPSGRVLCGGSCVDVNSDLANCGSCGHACPSTATCSASICVCPGGATACGTSCVNTSTDNANCGTCGNACSAPATCMSGTCSCGSGLTACGSSCVNLSTSTSNCGACGNVCAAGQSCNAGMCSSRPAAGAYSIPFAPETTAGTALTLSDDSISAALPIGFTFRFFTNSYTSLVVSSNGFVSFNLTSPNGCCAGSPIPTADTINNIIAAVWTDLYPPGAGSVTYQTRGTAPNRRFVVSWTGVPFCCSTTAAVTTQIILYEGTDRIAIYTATIAAGSFRIMTQGVENAAGTVAYYMPGRDAVSFTLTNDGAEFYTY